MLGAAEPALPAPAAVARNAADVSGRADVRRCECSAAAATGTVTLGEGVTIDGDYLAGEFDGEAILRGNVVISEGDRSISAGELRVNPVTKAASVRGTVEYRDPAIVIRGDAGKFSNGEAQVDGAEFELPQQPARGAARSLSLNQAGVLTLEGVSYTTCPIRKPDWRIQADSVSLDTRTRIGVARDARVEFLGVPILRLPWISFPIGDARKTGFLFPSLGSSSRGGLLLSAALLHQHRAELRRDGDAHCLHAAAVSMWARSSVICCRSAKGGSTEISCRTTASTTIRAAASNSPASRACRATGA